jgi:hypothetical protein
MKSCRYPVLFSCAVIVAAGALVAAQRLPIEPPKAFGTSITGAFEGWFDYPSGNGRGFLVGYLNRNLQTDVDVPIGPNNRIEPGGPDMGQPTHFLHGRRYGMFVVAVPKDFTSADQRLTWTIVINGESTVIPLRLHPDYVVSPFTDLAVGNKPPVVRLSEDGPTSQGPIAVLATAQSTTAKMSEPLALAVWATDDAKYSSGTNAPMRNPPPPVRMLWSQFRGEGKVTFAETEPKFEATEGGEPNQPYAGKATTTATFSAPGDYVLHATVNDYSGEGGGGEVCCWTTAMLKVKVTE